VRADVGGKVLIAKIDEFERRISNGTNEKMGVSHIRLQKRNKKHSVKSSEEQSPIFMISFSVLFIFWVKASSWPASTAVFVKLSIIASLNLFRVYTLVTAIHKIEKTNTAINSLNAKKKLKGKTTTGTNEMTMKIV